MEIMALLKSFIYLVSSSLLIPVLLLLSGLTVWLLVYCGSFFALWLARKRQSEPGDIINLIKQHEFTDLSRPVQYFCRCLLQIRDDDLSEMQILNLLRETELKLWKALDNLKIMIRIGPGLGLIGTLIPMGTGLASLGQGDLTRLSGDLVIAFTTTVVGMALGLICYFLFTIQRRWVEEDVKNMELAAEMLSIPVPAAEQA